VPSGRGPERPRRGLPKRSSEPAKFSLIVDKEVATVLRKMERGVGIVCDREVLNGVVDTTLQDDQVEAVGRLW
jgi:hypothetical protein